ncbi:MAG: ABC transporter ATP-binding protein [Phycisphaerae bacterium]|nr:ABC transporter ATP-binding protein [Phycisphaerae bacterium]
MIELRNISKRFGRLVVLDHLTLNIEAGKSIVIIGPSGTGKSVLLKHIVGLLRPDSGEVWFDGHRVDNLSENALMVMRQRFGFLFQMGALFDSQTVEENVGFPLTEHSHKSPDEIHQIVIDKLGLVGLPELGPKMPGQLSGGQKKRVALARAIALDPQVILYDEPTTGLDPVRADVINELIVRLNQRLNVTSVTVTHDMASAFKIADRIVMLHDGKMIFDGTPTEVQTTDNPVVKRFVRGEADESELMALDAQHRETHQREATPVASRPAV